MTRKIQDALVALLQLPEKEQEEAADALLDFAATKTGVETIQLSDAQVAEVERRMRNPRRKYLTLEESRAKIATLSGYAD